MGTRENDRQTNKCNGKKTDIQEKEGKSKIWQKKISYEDGIYGKNCNLKDASKTNINFVFYKVICAYLCFWVKSQSVKNVTSVTDWTLFWW